MSTKITPENSGKKLIEVSTRGTAITKKSSQDLNPKSKIIPLDCKEEKVI